MATLSKAQLFTEIDNTIFTNGNEEINAADHNALLKSMVQSFFGIIDDANRAEFAEYDPTKTYNPDDTQAGVMFSGGIYQAKPGVTNITGAFDVADWNQIGSGTFAGLSDVDLTGLNDDDLFYWDNATMTVRPFQIGIAAGSATRLNWDAVNKELSLTALGITDVTEDGTEANLADWVTANYTGSELQEGDVLILTVPSEAYIHNGGNAGTVADFTLLETPGLSDSQVRALFSATGTGGLSYNAVSGAFTLNLFSGGSPGSVPASTTITGTQLLADNGWTLKSAINLSDFNNDLSLNTIYNSDDTLGGNRVITMGGNNLTLQDSAAFEFLLRTDTSNSPEMRFRAATVNGGTNGSIYWTSNSGLDVGRLDMGHDTADQGSGRFTILTRSNGGSLTRKVYVGGGGNVGIWAGIAAAPVSHRLEVRGIGETSGTYSFVSGDVNGVAIFRVRDDNRIVYNDGNETAGYVLTTDANGVATWQAAGGADGNGIYDGSGSLSGNTTVTLGSNELIFSGTGTVSVNSALTTSPFIIKSSSGSALGLINDADGIERGKTYIDVTTQNWHFDTVGAAYVYHISGTEKFRLTNASGNAQVSINDNVATPGATLKIKGAGNTGGTLSLLIQNSSNQDIIRVQDDRLVGIGRTAPGASLDIQRQTALPALIVRDNAGASRFEAGNASGDLNFFAGSMLFDTTTNENRFRAINKTGFDFSLGTTKLFVIRDFDENFENISFNWMRFRSTGGTPEDGVVSSPGIRLQGKYDALPGAGITDTISNGDIFHEMISAGATPVSNIRFNVNGTLGLQISSYGYPQTTVYTVATLPNVGNGGGIIAVSDETGGYTIAFSDGTNWRRVQDRTIVS